MSPQSLVTMALVLGVATLLPALALAATSFVKISAVLAGLRGAFHGMDLPGNLAVLGLSAILTLHVMAPTAEAVVTAAGPAITAATAADPSSARGAELWADAWLRGRAPVVRFLRANARNEDRAFFASLAAEGRARQGATWDRAQADDDVTVLLPAFVVSELSRAFVIVFLLLLPFLVVELVVANMLTSAGLQGVSSATVSLPFKLLLFVSAGGWHHLARALVLAYR